MAPPVMAVVSMTPNVARMIPCPRTGRISLNLVSMPPENRMTLSAIIPMNWAIVGLLNWMPTPSLPNAIPTPRKSSNIGTPNL